MAAGEGPGCSRGCSCTVPVKIAPGDASMQQSSRKSPWPHTAFPCQLHFSWLPGESHSPARPLWREAGQALPQDSIPLLVPFNCSLHNPGSLEEQRNEEEEGNPSMRGMELCCSRLSWVGRTQQAGGPLEQSRQQKCVLSLPENCQPSSGNGAHPFPQPWPRGSPRPALPHRRASPGVLRQQ